MRSHCKCGHSMQEHVKPGLNRFIHPGSGPCICCNCEKFEGRRPNKIPGVRQKYCQGTPPPQLRPESRTGAVAMVNCGKVIRPGQPWICNLPEGHEGECISKSDQPNWKTKTKLWYRCEMCSPRQSKDFECDVDNLTVDLAYLLVKEEHDRISPKCPATGLVGPNSVAVEFLVRMIQ